MTRERLEKLPDFKIMNEYRESSGKRQMFTCLFCVYWLLNTVIGLFIVDTYGEYLKESYPDLSSYILMFSLKWFTSIALAIALVLIISVGSAMRCFMGEAEEIWASMIGMAFPLYCLCLILQQYYATGYGLWFFHVQSLGDERPEDTPDFSTMESDCLDLTQMFFINEIIVGVLTFC